MIGKIFQFLPSVAIPIAVNFVLITLYAMILSPTAYGEYSIYINSIAIIYALTSGFIQSAAFRFYSMDQTDSNPAQYLTTFILANLGVSFVVSAILFGLSFVLELDWRVIAFAMSATGFYQFFLNWYRLRDSTIGFAFGRLSASFGALAAILVWMAMNESASFAVPIYTFYGAYFVLIVVGLASIARHISIRSFSTQLLVRAFRYGAPLSWVSAVSLLVPYGAQFAILFYLSQADVGAYSLGFRLSDATLANVTMIVLTVMTPAVMRAYDRPESAGDVSSTVLLTKVISLNFWATIPIACIFIVSADPLIELVFPAYEGAQTILVWVVLAAVLRSLSMITVKGLELTGATRLLLMWALVAAIVNIAYLVAFVPLYGLTAAGHASFVSYLLLNVLLVTTSRSRAPIVIDYGYLAKVLVSSVIATLGALGWGWAFPVTDWLLLGVQVILFGILYLGVSFALKLHRGFSVPL